ncbi:hypothetical protein CGLO_06991 [Colletotrichum gloeosporioides Cg-14]|uniref:Uncharacterized protein n=1 Tax=Colletotrichum gloeosporioides (strain Cg-14) TaxID=1237896 RepID=T0KCY5_COLGC|nr:hypothetical protein CGLO_06991 [Colletotrichum gloeosporioides Cg-14]
MEQKFPVLEARTVCGGALRLVVVVSTAVPILPIVRAVWPVIPGA